jgi:hypothetical protein
MSRDQLQDRHHQCQASRCTCFRTTYCWA